MAIIYTGPASALNSALEKDQPPSRTPRGTPQGLRVLHEISDRNWNRRGWCQPSESVSGCPIRSVFS